MGSYATIDPGSATSNGVASFEQMSFVEIGQRMNRSDDAARKLWARAIDMLRRVLAVELSGPFDSKSVETGDD